MEEIKIDVKKTMDALQKLRKTDGKRIAVNAKDKEFYDVCPHCSSEFYYQYDNVTFTKQDDDLDSDNLDVENTGELYSQMLKKIMSGGLYSNGSSRTIVCPVCKNVFNPTMKTKEEMDSYKGGTGLLGMGLSKI